MSLSVVAIGLRSIFGRFDHVVYVVFSFLLHLPSTNCPPSSEDWIFHQLASFTSEWSPHFNFFNGIGILNLPS